MIQFEKITKALKAQLEGYPDVANILKEPITRGGFVNEDPSRAPWMGVYRGQVKYEPRTLGPGLDNWEGTPSIRIVVQAASYKDGETVEDNIEDFVRKTIEGVLDDTTLDGTIDMVNNISVDYGYNETDRGSIYFQTAIITLELEVATL